MHNTKWGRSALARRAVIISGAVLFGLLNVSSAFADVTWIIDDTQSSQSLSGYTSTALFSRSADPDDPNYNQDLDTPVGAANIYTSMPQDNNGVNPAGHPQQYRVKTGGVFVTDPNAPNYGTSLTSKVGGSFTTTTAFETSVDFGPEGTYTDPFDYFNANPPANLQAPTAAEISAYFSVASGVLGAELDAQAKIISGNSGPPGANWVPELGGGPTVNNFGTPQPANMASIQVNLNAGNALLGWAVFRDGRFDTYTPDGEEMAVDPQTGEFNTETGMRLGTFNNFDFNFPGLNFQTDDITIGALEDIFADVAVAHGGTTSITLPTYAQYKPTLPLAGDNEQQFTGEDATATITRAFDPVTGTNRLYVMESDFLLIASLDADVGGDTGGNDTGAIYIQIRSPTIVTSHTRAVADTEPGDANFDGTVDIFDVGVISDSWTDTGVIVPGDVNGDGQVDIFDVGMASDFWSGAGASAVPEPSSFVLAGLGLVAVLFVRRRRK